jgi:hypothetical protein
MADHLEPPRFTAKSIREIRPKIGELFEIDPQKRDQPRDLAAVLKQFAFLPTPLAVVLEGDEVVISPALQFRRIGMQQ